VTVSGAAAEKREECRVELIDRGRSLYDVYCVACHGKGLEGDGPIAGDLETPPSDLTRISERNGGEFPFTRVYSIIEGFDDIPSHRDREMPRWGFAFQELDSDADQRDQVRGRILQLIYFLETEQKGDPRPLSRTRD
jgi:mono/diheme cytochrome c family protein